MCEMPCHVGVADTPDTVAAGLTPRSYDKGAYDYDVRRIPASAEAPEQVYGHGGIFFFNILFSLSTMLFEDCTDCLLNACST